MNNTEAQQILEEILAQAEKGQFLAVKMKNGNPPNFVLFLLGTTLDLVLYSTSRLS